MKGLPFQFYFSREDTLLEGYITNGSGNDNSFLASFDKLVGTDDVESSSESIMPLISWGLVGAIQKECGIL